MLYLTLRQYEYVCAIGQAGSLSAAAEQLNVSQPALSAALTKIEAHLGHALFIRKQGAALALTPNGRSFVEEADALLSRAARLEDPRHPRPPASRLRLGCFVDLAPFLLAPALHGLRDALPDMTVTYRADGFVALISALLNGQLDIAITYDLGMDAGFERCELYQSRPNALVAPDHPLAARESVSLDALTEYPLILSDEGVSAQHMLGLFRQIGRSPNVAHRAASLEILRSLASNGEGVGLSYANPPNMISYDGKPIVSLPIHDPHSAESVVLARHGSGPTDPMTARAFATLQEMFGTG